MKRILFLLLSICCVGAHAQLTPVDARYFNNNQYRAINNGIAASSNPLKTTITKLVADTVAKSKRITDLTTRIKNITDSLFLSVKQNQIQQLALDSVKFYTGQLNKKIYETAFWDSTRALAIKNTVDQRSRMLNGVQFKDLNGTTSINTDWLTAWVKQLIGMKSLQAGGSGEVNLTELEEEIKKAKTK